MRENLDKPPDVSPNAARILSRKIAGGAQYRIEIGAAIADDPATITTADLARQLGLQRQSVNQELLLLEELGLIERVSDPDPGSSRKVYFRRVDAGSSYWSWCKEALEGAPTMLRKGLPF